MKNVKCSVLFVLFWFSITVLQAGPAVELVISRTYLNLPVSNQAPSVRLAIFQEDQLYRIFDIHLAEKNPDYWVYIDVSKIKGKRLNLALVNHPQKHFGLDLIFQDDKIVNQDNLYKEKWRPQFHFTSRRGWNNDPNGLVFYDHEYHLFYQHNPYGTMWGNMHWGHAVSRDLIHWNEIGEALFAQKDFTIFSGSAVVDWENSSAFQTDAEHVLVAAFTANWDDRKGRSFQQQHLAYSNDRGRTWQMYDDNPVIGVQEEKWNTRYNRDPKVFWFADSSYWVMALYEQIGISIYTSGNLKDWVYQSHTEGFYECPELFELSVDGDPAYKKWVMYSASGSYVIGDFDGKKFTWESSKHWYTDGALYAAQTFNNIPAADGRRIQMGWGRIASPEMPFNQMILFPTTLNLRTTPEGPRLYCEPVMEIEKLHKKKYQWHNLLLDEINVQLKDFKGELLHIKCELETVDSQQFGMIVHGNRLVYDIGNGDRFNGFPYALTAGGKSLYMEILVDRTSIETFLDHGALYSVMAKDLTTEDSGVQFWSVGTTPTIYINNLEIYTLRSIWP